MSADDCAIQVRNHSGEFAMGATFSKATPIPELLFVAFQCTFAAITCACCRATRAPTVLVMSREGHGMV